MNEITDAQGIEIKAGDRVIYNLSGELALGEIISAEIIRRENVTYAPYYRNTYKIQIKFINGNRGLAPKHGISIVRNPKSIFVDNAPKYIQKAIDAFDFYSDEGTFEDMYYRAEGEIRTFLRRIRKALHNETFEDASIV